MGSEPMLYHDGIGVVRFPRPIPGVRHSLNLDNLLDPEWRVVPNLHDPAHLWERWIAQLKRDA